ncbi:MAG TPA: hypothetical protein VFY39_17250 [Gammaproteobacteria bacterium]|nr:hypothetical protein [Gammaproteobacteria bacterium]
MRDLAYGHPDLAARGKQAGSELTRHRGRYELLAHARLEAPVQGIHDVLGPSRPS